jgi:hypothetical protein
MLPLMPWLLCLTRRWRLASSTLRQDIDHTAIIGHEDKEFKDVANDRACSFGRSGRENENKFLLQKGYGIKIRAETKFGQLQLTAIEVVEQTSLSSLTSTLI